jgi:hypothetical protein
MTDHEINEAVARKLGDKTAMKEFQEFHRHCPISCGGKSTPDYCHSIAAAWQILEYVSRSCPPFPHIFSLHRNRDGTWQCYFPSYVSTTNAIADTAPMAIALAFLTLEDK